MKTIDVTGASEKLRQRAMEASEKLPHNLHAEDCPVYHHASVCCVWPLAVCVSDDFDEREHLTSREKGILVLRDLYVEAKKVLDEVHPANASMGEVLFHKHCEGVVEGIRRAAYKLYGVIDEQVVTGEAPFVEGA